MTKLSDKEWLDRVCLGYRIYTENNQVCQQTEAFIMWLHEQYGIVKPKSFTSVDSENLK